MQEYDKDNSMPLELHNLQTAAHYQLEHLSDFSLIF